MKQLCLCGCGESFTPGNNRKYKTPACRKRLAYALKKKAKSKLRKCKVCYEKRIPAVHKQPEVAPVFRRADDWDHGKYVEYKKQMKKLNGRVCMAEGCEVGCFGFNFFCGFHQEQNYRKAENHGFLEEGGSRRSASGIYG